MEKFKAVWNYSRWRKCKEMDH